VEMELDSCNDWEKAILLENERDQLLMELDSIAPAPAIQELQEWDEEDFPF